MTIKDVHTRHCCKVHGCKYGEDQEIESLFDNDSFIPCTVVSGRAEQEGPCEYCSPEYEEIQGWQR